MSKKKCEYCFKPAGYIIQEEVQDGMGNSWMEDVDVCEDHCG